MNNDLIPRIERALHERFDQCLDEVKAQLPEANATLAQVSETIWSLRQGLTAGVAHTLIEQSHSEERVDSLCAAQRVIVC